MDVALLILEVVVGEMNSLGVHVMFTQKRNVAILELFVLAQCVVYSVGFEVYNCLLEQVV
jgi:hypothetical protein